MPFQLFRRGLKPVAGTAKAEDPSTFKQTLADRAADRSASGTSPGSWQAAIKKLEQLRGSHVIGVIHRYQAPGEHPFDWLMDAYVGDRHLEDFMTSLRQVPPDAKLDVVLHSIGGFSFVVKQMARAIRAHKGPTTVFVPYYAHGYSTLLALSSDQIVMGSTAALSYLEMWDEPLKQVLRAKGSWDVEDTTVLAHHFASQFSRELREFVSEIAKDGRAVREIVGTQRSGSDPVTAEIAVKMGLPVSTDMPGEVLDLIRLCRAMPIPDYGVQSTSRMPGRNANHSLRSLHSELRRGTGPAWQLLEGSEKSDQTDAQLNKDQTDSGDGESLGVASENCDVTVRPIIARMESARGSRVICVIHQPGMESDFVDSVTSADILAALQTTPPDMPLDIILHTPGGEAYGAMQIARAIKAHRGRKTVFVPYFAMSGGTIIALAADEIVLAPHAVLGPIDLQVLVHSGHGFLPAAAIVRLTEVKPRRAIGDELLELSYVCKRHIAIEHKNAVALMAQTYSKAAAEKIAHQLNDGIYTHSYPITVEKAAKMGLKVSTAMPQEPTEIVRAFRRRKFGQRSVIYCS